MTLKPCGTYAAYMRHIRRGETPCHHCHTEYRNLQATYHQNRKTRDNSRDRDTARRHRPPQWLPLTSPDNAHHAPCARDEYRYNNLWEPARESEPDHKVIHRWKAAAAICLTDCPVLDHCKQSMRMCGDDSGVWAGHIPQQVRR